MKTISFEFVTSRAVPFYHQTLVALVNQGAPHVELRAQIREPESTPGQHEANHWCYQLLASGQQAHLEAFADELAAKFPLSCFLLDAKVKALTQEDIDSLSESDSVGNEAHFDNADYEYSLPFCGHCFPRLGDNQSPEFGLVSLSCPHCHGEQQLPAGAPTLDELKQLAASLIADGSLALDGKTYQLSGYTATSSLLFTNPNTLSSHLAVSDADVLALSSIEKPRLRLLPTSEHPRLKAPSYRVRFAQSRVELVLCELLRVKGIEWLYVNKDNSTDICAVDGRWQVISESGARTLRLSNSPLHHPPLHNQASAAGYQAHTHKGTIRLTPTGFASVKSPALLALRGQLQATDKRLAHHASLYLGGKGALEIATVDGNGKEEIFFTQTPLPENGYEIYRLLMESPQRQVLEKFKSLFPQECLCMLDLILSPTAERGNLQGIWALGACILGLGLNKEKPSVEYLADALVAEAQKFRGQSAPRIDYPLIRGEAVRSFNWCKTLGTLMSFRLAGDTDAPKLAFAMMDSLADYLANWIEHLDLNVGVKQVYLSGSELANPVLAKRIWLRLGKNFPLLTAPELDLDGSLFALGSLYTETPRRFGALGREAHSVKD
ncbi:NiFe hydrogenase [Shewanella zhangzhouensis]|uniref:NiFe hydrogenase n=1 Tax=Shewanella zhangzhouensis TaxID=2864213 RepID=UPI001C657C62|nr:NiFe hydrogenase [Shewanella zhangzhouensis]QYK06918.1 NiFe hydrogenase [Shewanella zhangzhouensis]